MEHETRASGELIELHTTRIICRYFVKKTQGIVKEVVSILALAAETERPVGRRSAPRYSSVELKTFRRVWSFQ